MGLIALIFAIGAAVFVVVLKMVPVSLIAMAVPLLLGIWAIVKKSKKILGVVALLVSALVIFATPFLFQKGPSLVKSEVKKKENSSSPRSNEEKPPGQQQEETGRVKFVKHKDRAILSVDLSGTSPQEALQTIEQVEQSLKSHPEKSILISADISDSRVDARILKRSREVALKNGQNIERMAIIGASAPRKILIRSAAVSARMTDRVSFFEDSEKANEWLTAETGKAGPK